MSERAVWSAAFINSLPDAAFAVVESGGKKDEQGKTTPRRLRHLPHHTSNVKKGTEHGTVDKPHLRNALARLEQSKLSATLKAKARRHLEAHAKALGIGAAGKKGEGAIMSVRTLKLGMLSREATFKRETLKRDARTVRLSFSSETLVMRYPWGDPPFKELLSHDPAHIRTERIDAGVAPFLVAHNRYDLAGRIEPGTFGTTEKRTGEADIRFSRSARGQEIMDDVEDEVRVGTSISYRVYEYEDVASEEGDDDEIRTLRAVDWEIFEASSEPIPADFSVGVGRSDTSTGVPPDDLREVQVRCVTQEDPDDDTEEERQDTAPGGADGDRASEEPPQPEGEVRTMGEEAQVQVTEARKDGETSERTRVTEILALGQLHGEENFARTAVAEGVSLEAFRQSLLERIGKREKPLPPDPAASEIGMTDRQVQRYSISRAIMAYVTDDWSRAGFERECHQAAAEKYSGRDIRGFIVPDDMLRRRALVPAKMGRTGLAGGTEVRADTLIVGTDALGGYLKGTTLLASAFIDLLMDQLVVKQAGATVLPGLVGDVAIPRYATGAETHWVAEDTDVTGDTATAFEQVTLTPKTVGAWVPVSRKLLQQSTPAVDDLVTMDLARQIALAVEQGALILDGSPAAEPTGVAYQTGVGGVSHGTNGGPETLATLIEYETDVAVANAAVGNLAYICNAKTRGHWKGTDKGTDTGHYLWDIRAGETPVNGYPCHVTNVLPSNLTKGTGTNLSMSLFGNWVEVLIGLWGGLDVWPDKYKYADKGGLVIRGFQTADTNIRHPGSFSVGLDLNTA